MQSFVELQRQAFEIQERNIEVEENNARQRAKAVEIKGKVASHWSLRRTEF
jgi:hypothetical protein